MGDMHAVTGPFSYTGKYIAEALHDRGVTVRGFVRTQPETSGAVDCRPLQFGDAEKLARDLDGCRVLYNTYWIRFERDGRTFDQAVRNTSVLAQAARSAGVEKIVHISVSNPSRDSPFAYFRGKAAAEEAVQSTGVSCSIIRPTLVFGREDILINNIAWMLRRFHVFPMPGNGKYQVQPVFVGDVAALALAEADNPNSPTLDAAAPEVFTFWGLLKLLGWSMKVPVAGIRTPPALSLLGGAVMSRLLGDVVITDEELGALRAETLVSHQPATTTTKLTDWLSNHADELGRRYTSELKRHWASA